VLRFFFAPPGVRGTRRGAFAVFHALSCAWSALGPCPPPRRCGKISAKGVIILITEYYVLNALSGGGWFTVDEIAPSSEWDDRWATKKIIEMLEGVGLVESLRSSDNTNSYHISIAGEYRLQQLKEQLDHQQRAEADSQKQNRENRIWQLISVTIGLLTLVTTVLFGILGLLR